MRCRVLESGICEVTQEYKGTQHGGIDVVNKEYTLGNIVAHSDGEVVEVRNNCNSFESGGSYGNYVKVKHDNGYYTLYAHMAYNTVKVSKGQRVSKGQLLGYMGSTGTAYGGHLHFEVRNTSDVRIDPTSYLDADLPNSQAPTKSVDELAREVIEGKYGNGEDRKNALGDRYSEVQARVNEILAPKVNYLSNSSYNGVSIVDALKQIGVDSSYGYRARLAEVNGIGNYRGTAEQNTYMLELLKKGTLKSV